MPVPVSPPAGDSSDESRHGENRFAATSLLKLPSMCKRRPSSPAAAICASAAIAGKKRLSVPIPSTMPASRHASVARSASAFVNVSGFSQNTAFLARADARICSRCNECAVASTTASIAECSSTAASAPMVSRPCSAVKSRTRTGSRLTAWVMRNLSLLPCTELTRVWPQRPSPTIAARIIASPGLSGYGAANLIPPDAEREGGNDRIMDLGDAERPQGAYRAGGAGTPVQRHPGQYRRRRPAQAGIPQDHAQPPHSGDRRFRRTGRQAVHAVRVGGDLDLTVRENRRQAEPERPDRPLQMLGMDHVPDGRDRADVRPMEPFRRLRQGKAALRDRALHERGGATDTRAEQAARRDALAGRR